MNQNIKQIILYGYILSPKKEWLYIETPVYVPIESIPYEEIKEIVKSAGVNYYLLTYKENYIKNE